MMDWTHVRDAFGPLLGIVAGAVWTVGALIVAVFGPIKHLRLPVESVPGLSRGLLNALLVVPFLICFALINEELAVAALIGSLIPWGLFFWCYRNYGIQLGIHRFTRPRSKRWWQVWRKAVAEDIIVGGSVLTPSAQAKIADTGSSLQDVLASAAYDPDAIWVRESRIATQMKVEIWYYGFLLFSILAVVLVALGFQTLLTHKSPLRAAQDAFKIAPNYQSCRDSENGIESVTGKTLESYMPNQSGSYDAHAEAEAQLIRQLESQSHHDIHVVGATYEPAKENPHRSHGGIPPGPTVYDRWWSFKVTYDPIYRMAQSPRCGIATR